MKERDMERILKALANRRRLAILRYIRKEKEATVGDIAHEIKLSFKATSKHLGRLASANILEMEQVSRHVAYRLAPDAPEVINRILTLT